MTRSVGVAAAMALAIGATGVARQADDRARANWPAGVIRVDVLASDANGAPISGLNQSDFELLVDGQPHPIARFSSDASPLTVAVLVDVTASLHRNVAGVAGSPSSVLMGAGADLEASLATLRAPDEIAPAVAEFALDGVRSSDRIRVGAIGRRLILSDRFTSDARERAQSWHAVFNLPPVEWLGPSPLWDAVAEATSMIAGGAGHRAIVIITDGEAGGNLRGSREVAELAALAGVSVNVVAEEAVFSQWPFTPMSAQGIDPAKALRVMADTTGGAAVLDRTAPGNDGRGLFFTREPATCLRYLLDRLHHAYALGFLPAIADGHSHTLEVRAKKPGVIVTARKIFTASAGVGRPTARSSPS